MREGSLEAPIRHALDWQNPDFTDREKIDEEMRRVFDICHGCRRCFNLCESFPTLFDLVDNSTSGEVDGVDPKDYKKIVDGCTLCDLCFMTKCPYVPPHEWAVDFPHLMLRYRAAELKAGHQDRTHAELTETDRNGKAAAFAAPLVNWASKTPVIREVIEKVAGIDADAKLPNFHSSTFEMQAKAAPMPANEKAPAFGRKAVLFATCFCNYNNPDIGMATLAVLAQNGVATEVVYPRCCGMPQLERGDIARVASHAQEITEVLLPFIDAGYDIVAPVPSCALMIKFEWPLILPNDATIKKISEATFDVSEYVVDIAGKEGLAPGLRKLDGDVALHIACHARAQNMGQKAREMLNLIPGIDMKVIERCSGHGGAWGVMKGNFDSALKIGKPVAREATAANKKYVVSECPLAGEHILQGMERLGETAPKTAPHPIQLLAMAYGLV